MSDGPRRTIRPRRARWRWSPVAAAGSAARWRSGSPGPAPTSSSPAATRTPCESSRPRLRETTGVRALGIGAHVGRWDDAGRAGGRGVRRDRASRRPGQQRRHVAALRRRRPTVSEELFDKVLGVNLKGPFRLTALVGTRMAAGDGGSIINISQHRARCGRGRTSCPYAAAKAGLNALTVGFAHTFGPSVRVNAIMAGTFLTDVSKAWDMEAFAERAQGFALERGGEPRGDRRRGALPRQRRLQLHDRLDPHRRRRPALTGSRGRDRASTTQTCLTSRRRSADTPATSQPCPEWPRRSSSLRGHCVEALLPSGEPVRLAVEPASAQAGRRSRTPSRVSESSSAEHLVGVLDRSRARRRRSGPRSPRGAAPGRA